MDQPYSGLIKIVRNVETGDKPNPYIPLKTRTGNVSMLLTSEQWRYIKAINNNDVSVINWFKSKGFIKEVSTGIRYFPFVPDEQLVVIIYQKGLYSQLLSIGTNPNFSEAYSLNAETCNPSMTKLQHVFTKWTMSGTVQTTQCFLPILQPKPLANGTQDFWSVPTAMLK